MEKLNELQQEFATKHARMVEIAKSASDEKRAKTEDETTEWNSLDNETKGLKERMETAKFLEEQGKTEGETKEAKTDAPAPKTLVQSFRDSINKAMNDKRNISFDVAKNAAITTTTDTGLINKEDLADLKILTTPGKAFLEKLGVKVHTGLTGNLPLPNMGQLTGTFLAEEAANSEFTQEPATITMTGKRISKKKSFTVEYLAQADDKTLKGILADMLNMPWRVAVEDLMDAVNTDAVDASLASGVGGYSDVTALPAGVPFDKVSPAFVSTYSVASEMKVTPYMANQVGIFRGLYEDGEVDGYKAYAHSGVNTGNLIFGDWSFGHVGVWQSPEIIVDPLTERDNGKIKFIVEAQMDSAVGDYRAFKWYADASIA